MSVQFNQYLIYGIKLNYKEFVTDDEVYDSLEKYMDSAFKKDDINPNGLHCLFDGMSGEYVIIGRCIEKSEVYQPIEYMVIDQIDKDVAILTESLIKSELGIVGTCKLHLVTHYS